MLTEKLWIRMRINDWQVFGEKAMAELILVAWLQIYNNKASAENDYILHNTLQHFSSVLKFDCYEVAHTPL